MSHPLLNAFWMMLWFFLWVIWLMSLFRVITDLFRDRGLSGWAKAGWVAGLKADGTLSEEEFQRAKQKILA